MEPRLHTLIISSHVILLYQDYSQSELSNIFHMQWIQISLTPGIFLSLAAEISINLNKYWHADLGPLFNFILI